MSRGRSGPWATRGGSPRVRVANGRNQYGFVIATSSITSCASCAVATSKGSTAQRTPNRQRARVRQMMGVLAFIESEVLGRGHALGEGDGERVEGGSAARADPYSVVWPGPHPEGRTYRWACPTGPARPRQRMACNGGSILRKQ